MRELVVPESFTSEMRRFGHPASGQEMQECGLLANDACCGANAVTRLQAIASECRPHGLMLEPAIRNLLQMTRLHEHIDRSLVHRELMAVLRLQPDFVSMRSDIDVVDIDALTSALLDPGRSR